MRMQISSLMNDVSEKRVNYFDVLDRVVIVTGSNRG